MVTTSFDIEITVKDEARDRVEMQLIALLDACKSKAVTIRYTRHADSISAAVKQIRESDSVSKKV